jgi:hypothetical protein
MTNLRPVRLTLLLLTAGLALSASAQQSGRTPTPLPNAPRPVTTPKLEAVAETRLLMVGLIQPNYSGLEKQLAQRPADAETWGFTRGQALLVAESGNLLMLRPPRSGGQDIWMQRATELRETGSTLARYAAARDYERSQTALRDVAGACNRCHQTFRVPTRIGGGLP